MSSREIDFGRVSLGGVARKTVFIRNAGRQPLHIENVKLSCVCSSAKLSRPLIPPGDSADLELSVRGIAQRRETHGLVFLISNDPRSPVVELSLRFSALDDVWVEPTSLDLGRVPRETLPVARSVHVHFARDAKIDLAPLACSTTSPYFKAAIVPNGDQAVVDVQVELGAEAPSGEHRAAVVLESPGGSPSVSVELHAFVRGAVYAVPPDVVLGSLRKENAGRNLQSITIRRRDGKAARLMASLSNDLDSILELRERPEDELEVCLRSVASIQSELAGVISVRVMSEGADDELLTIPVTLIWATDRVERQ